MRRLTASWASRPMRSTGTTRQTDALLAALGDDILADVTAPADDLEWDERQIRIGGPRDAREPVRGPRQRQVVSSGWSAGYRRWRCSTTSPMRRDGGLSASARRGPGDRNRQLVIGLYDRADPTNSGAPGRHPGPAIATRRGVRRRPGNRPRRRPSVRAAQTVATAAS